MKPNEAAKRLRQIATNGQSVNHSEYLSRLALIDAALAEERRLVVAQLREEWFDHPAIQDDGEYECACEGAGHHGDIEKKMALIEGR